MLAVALSRRPSDLETVTHTVAELVEATGADL
jgi:hypothetical protein